MNPLLKAREVIFQVITRVPRPEISQLPLLISLLALLTSARGCSVASEAYNLSAKQYGQERRLILKGLLVGDAGEIDEIRVSPVDSSMALLSGTAIFPKSIYEHEIPIQSDGKFLFVKGLAKGIQDDIVKTMKNKGMHKQPGLAATGFNGWIPFAIQMAYAAKGEPYSDRSLYLLGVDWVDTDDPGEPPLLYPRALIFVQRIPGSFALTYEYLEKLKSSPKLGFDYKSP